MERDIRERMKDPGAVRVAVLMGGLSEEREISLKTGRAVLDALRSRGYDAVEVDAGRDLPARLAEGGFDAAFIALHGRYGEDGCVQGLLEVMGMPYTGSGVRASAIAMDKAMAKRVMVQNGIPTPAFEVLRPGQAPHALSVPVAVKPSGQGSAIGVSMVRTPGRLGAALAEAGGHGGEVLVEELIEGRELTVAILDNVVYPVVEIRPREGFYDYEAKYTKGKTDFLVPAPLDAPTAEKVMDTARAAYDALGCSGAARVDLMLSAEGSPWVLEVNTIPGLTGLSLFPRAAEAAGVSYPELVEKMLAGAGCDKF